MKRGSWLVMIAVAIALSLAIGCKRDATDGQFSKTVTFITPEPAPEGFDAWTFAWSYPRWDPAAQLDYIVLQPDGQTYFQMPIEHSPPYNPATDARSDFSPDVAGGDPGVFYGKKIKFTFRVNKGYLIFSPDGFYTFTFYKGGSEGQVIATQTAVMDSD